jgi:hypothetical protein
MCASLFLTSCTSTTNEPPKDNAVTRTGQDLTSLAAQAFQQYQDVKSGDTSYIWSIYKGLTTLGPAVVKTSTDVKEVVKQWGDSKVDVATGKQRSLVDRLASLFNSSDAPAAVKAAAMAKAAELVASDKGP